MDLVAGFGYVACCWFSPLRLPFEEYTWTDHYLRSPACDASSLLLRGACFHDMISSSSVRLLCGGHKETHMLNLPLTLLPNEMAPKTISNRRRRRRRPGSTINQEEITSSMTEGDLSTAKPTAVHDASQDTSRDTSQDSSQTNPQHHPPDCKCFLWKHKGLFLPPGSSFPIKNDVSGRKA